MRTVARWVFSRGSSARPGPLPSQQATHTEGETGKADKIFTDESSGPAAHPSQGSRVNPGSRLEAGAAQLEISSCPVIGHLSHESQATLPTITEEGSSGDKQSNFEHLPSVAEDLEIPLPVRKQTSIEVLPQGLSSQVRPCHISSHLAVFVFGSAELQCRVSQSYLARGCCASRSCLTTKWQRLKEEGRRIGPTAAG